MCPTCDGFGECQTFVEILHRGSEDLREYGVDRVDCGVSPHQSIGCLGAAWRLLKHLEHSSFCALPSSLRLRKRHVELWMLVRFGLQLIVGQLAKMTIG